MVDAVHSQLLGYLLGALDTSDQEEVESRLQAEPEFRAELEAIQSRLALPDRAAFLYDPPEGLAARTCRLVFAEAAPTPAPRRRAMTAQAAPPSWIHQLRWVDLAVAAAVLVVAAVVVVPAIQESRFHAGILGCKENLRQLGVAMTRYSEQHDGYFPAIPDEGSASLAGLYLPTLAGDGFLTEAQRAVCPRSPDTRRSDFRITNWDELRSAAADVMDRLRPTLSGIYGYHPGHLEDGVYRPTKNLRRPNFVLMADAPSFDLPGYQSLNHAGRGQCVLLEDGRVVFLTQPTPPAWREAIFVNDDGVMALGSDPNDSVIFPPTRPPVFQAGGLR